MTFTNITRAGLYMQCVHREVAPGETFIVPWLEARENRALRAAMNNRAVAWESQEGEPEVPGSVKLPTAEERAQHAKELAEKRAAAKAEAARKLREQQARDDRGVKANMARMGRFNVPDTRLQLKKVEAVATERPITRADIIADDKPKSLADIVRHNRAVRIVKVVDRMQAKRANQANQANQAKRDENSKSETKGKDNGDQER